MIHRSDSELMAADDANKVVHLSWIEERTRGMEVIADEGLIVVDSGLETDTFNVVCRARLERASLSERIDRVVSYFTSVARPFAWWVGPADRPSGLGEALGEAGLEEAGTEPAMAAELERVPTAEPSVPGLAIERVRTAAQVKDFGEILAALATPPSSTVLRFYELAAPAVLSPEAPIWLYVGYLDGAPVASAELAIGGGLVGLYNIATRSEHRGKGIGTAMTIRPLGDAREAGFQTAVLQASEDGFPIYRRLGFEVTGSFTEYHPRGVG